jgi:hypothetical protein
LAHELVINLNPVGQTGLSVSAKLYAAGALVSTVSLTESPASSGSYSNASALSLDAGLYAVSAINTASGVLLGSGSFEWDGSAEVKLNAVKAKTDLITAAGVTVNTPVDVNDDNRLNLIQGDSHESGTQLPTWTITGYAGPALGAAGKLRLLPIADYKTLGTAAAAELEVDAVVSQVSTTVTITAPITAAQSLDLSTFPPLGRDSHQYQVVGKTSSGSKDVTLRLAKATVSRRVEPA